MSAIGAFVARVVTTVGGPVATGAIVAGGIAVGALGGGLFASGGAQQASATGQLPVYPCPNTGPQIAVIQAGQQVLTTGRTADSTWLRIHFPEPGRPEAWVEAGPLTVDGAVASLPVAGCEPELAIAPPSTIPEESFTPASNNPPSAPPATATPAPNSRPVLASLTASTGQISYDTGSYCPTAVQKVTFKVKASDTGAVAAVSLFWRKPGASSFTQTPMTRVAGTPANGTWQVALDTAANGITTAGTLAYYAQATDDASATARIPVAKASTIQVKVCQNTGPTITAATSSSGSRLFWDPLSAGGCQTTSNITAVIKDVDGVSSATLFYRKPGAASWSSKPMNDTTVKGRWYANLDTLGDKITIPNPPTGSLRWYIRAADSKGAASQTSQLSMAIRRCDTEATIYVNSLATGSGSYCPDGNPPTTTVRIPFTFSITDPDTLVSVTLTYTVDNGTSGKRLTKTIKANESNGRFNLQSVALDGQTWYGQNIVTWTLTTRDLYGGTTQAPEQKGLFNIFVC
jgi:hypothetical protein